MRAAAGEATIAVNNGNAADITALHKINEEWTKDETKKENISVLAILVAKNTTTNQLLPLAMGSEEEVAVNDVKVFTVKDNTIYDLSGRHVSKPVRGLYIIGDKKVLIK